MSLYEKFTSTQNKGMLWSLLCEDGIFKNIPELQANNVKKEFDQKIETISQRITPADNLVNLCKRFITEMIKDIEKYKAPSEKITPVYNAAEIAQSRQKVFQEELTTKQKEFDTFNAVPTPAKIDFSDNLDAPIGSEMDKILAEQIALREKQLNMVLKTQDKEAASKWIQKSSEEPLKLKIGENIEINRVKKVNFVDDDFMAMLKRTSVSGATISGADTSISGADANTDISTANVSAANVSAANVSTANVSAANTTTEALLREILAKQNQILDILLK